MSVLERQLVDWLHADRSDPDYDPSWLARAGIDPGGNHALELALRESQMSAPHDKALVGRHCFVAYEGDVELYEDDRTGLYVPANTVLFDTGIVENVIVDTGKAAYLDRLGGLGGVAAFTVTGVGTDSTATSTAQTKLNPSVAGSVLLQAVDSGFPSRSALVLSFKSTFGTGVANFTWAEAGNFNGTVNGTSAMFNRVLIGPFAKTPAVSIAYTNTITQA